MRSKISYIILLFILILCVFPTISANHDERELAGKNSLDKGALPEIENEVSNQTVFSMDGYITPTTSPTILIPTPVVTVRERISTHTPATKGEKSHNNEVYATDEVIVRFKPDKIADKKNKETPSLLHTTLLVLHSRRIMIRKESPGCR